MKLRKWNNSQKRRGAVPHVGRLGPVGVEASLDVAPGELHVVVIGDADLLVAHSAAHLGAQREEVDAIVLKDADFNLERVLLHGRHKGRRGGDNAEGGRVSGRDGAGDTEDEGDGVGLRLGGSALNAKHVSDERTVGEGLPIERSSETKTLRN